MSGHAVLQGFRKQLGHLHAWLHHLRMLHQYDCSGFGPFVVLRSGEMVDLAFPPRRGTRIWELTNGRSVDSSEIVVVEDLSACGYKVRPRDYLEKGNISLAARK